LASEPLQQRPTMIGFVGWLKCSLLGPISTFLQHGGPYRKAGVAFARKIVIFQRIALRWRSIRKTL